MRLSNHTQQLGSIWKVADYDPFLLGKQVNEPAELKENMVQVEVPCIFYFQGSCKVETKEKAPSKKGTRGDMECGPWK